MSEQDNTAGLIAGLDTRVPVELDRGKLNQDDSYKVINNGFA